MLVHKGGQINNVQLITGLRIAEMSQLQNCSVKCTKNGSYCENVKKGGGGCVQRMEVIVKRKKSQLGVWGVGLGGQGGCELRSEAFVNIKKKKIFFWGGSGRRLGGGGRVGGGQGGCEWRSEAIVKINFFFLFFFFWGGGPVRWGGGGVRLGVRVDVNGELKLL